MASFCEYCGTPLKEGAKFCTGCGHPVAAKPRFDSQPRSNPQPQQRPQPQPPRQPKAEPTVQAQKPKKKGGCGKMLLIMALVSVAAVVAINKLSDIFGDGGGSGNHPTTETRKSKPVADNTGKNTNNRVINDESELFKLTEEDLAYFKEHPIEVTPENSPGNPAFIDVTFTDDDYAQGYGYGVSVTREMPVADIPDFGIHVNFKSWNLDYDEDTLAVVRLPDKIDENTGMILHSYEYFLMSGQNEFSTDVEITAPVQGDPDMFAGFVSYNEETGKWEDVYCELSDDRKTYTAYMSHFSTKSALEKIKTEGTAAINNYQIDGKTIFVQQKTEMKPKYEESSHYLYPVAVSSSVDFEKFFSQQVKDKRSMVEKLLKDYGKVSEEKAFESTLTWLGFGSDLSGNAVGMADQAGASELITKMKNLSSNKTMPKIFTRFGAGCTLIGVALCAYSIYDGMTNDNKDVWTALDDNKLGILSSALGVVGTIAGEFGIATTAAGTAATAASVGAGTAMGAAIIFAYSTIQLADDYYVKNFMHPLGMPSSFMEATIQLYMRDHSHVDGYAQERSVWSWGLPNANEQIDSVRIYEHSPEMLLDCYGKSWLPAYECLSDKYVNDPKGMKAACEKLYEDFVDAFWKEDIKTQRKYFRAACKEYIQIEMYDQFGNNQTNTSEVTSILPASLSQYPLNEQAKTEWTELQKLLVSGAIDGSGTKANKTVDDLWEDIFRKWDGNDVNRNFDVEFINRLKNNEAERHAIHDKLLDQLKLNTHDAAKDFYDKKYREGVLEVKSILDNVVLPLLNTRVTFYARNLEKPDGPYSSIATPDGNLPFLIEFNSTKVPRFLPRNSKEVETAFNLNLKANVKNAVLLETTAYHYLMFDCPTSADIEYHLNGDYSKKYTTTAMANWDNVDLVQEEQTEWSVWDLFGLPKVNIEDTKVPVEFNVQSAEEIYKVQHFYYPNEYQYYDLRKVLDSAFRNIRIKVTKNGDFSGTGSGKYDYEKRNEKSVYVGSDQATITISGHIDTDSRVGTFKMTAIGTYQTTFTGSVEGKKQFTCTFQGEGKIDPKEVYLSEKKPIKGLYFYGGFQGNLKGDSNLHYDANPWTGTGERTEQHTYDEKITYEGKDIDLRITFMLED